MNQTLDLDSRATINTVSGALSQVAGGFIEIIDQTVLEKNRKRRGGCADEAAASTT